ncbi:MAG: hypothetical protein Q8O72_09145 [Bacteroidales bacterium]|nr:hypothetical protein [Bacteroidales bacterium]
MKKHIYKLTLSVLAILGFLYSEAQTFEIRTVENDIGYLTVQMRETSGTGTPTTATNIVDITFVVRYPDGAVDIDLLCSSNNYNMIDGLAGEQTFEGYDYHYWNASNTPFNPPSNWTQNEWEDIAVFYASGATGSGLFEIAPNNWDGRSLNWNQGGTDYTPTINGDATYSYLTVVYNYVWEGGNVSAPFYDGNSWGNPANWQSECGAIQSSAPTSASNCYIPSGKANYPQNFYAFAGVSGTALANNVRIESGANINFLNVNADNFAISGDLLVDGTVTINPTSSVNPGISVAGSSTINATNGFIITPNASATFNGSTFQNAVNSIVVQSTATGTGSFIDNGTITYGASGSAKVQTYLSNSAGSGNFDIHLVGPTVDEENYTGAGTGAYLSAFNVVNGSTYAYSWDEAQVLLNGWQNINSLSYEVRTADGIGLSTIDNLPHTLEMTGSLMTGAISSPALTFSSNHYELISNPYPSSIDFDGLADDNSGVVNNAYWIWDPAANNYVERAAGVGGTQHIQVGQGFFVETNSAGTFNFSNARRTHSTVAFRETMTNILSIAAEGGMIGYRDDAIIRFDEQATSGYDVNMEAVFWESQNSDATSLRSVAEGNLELAINALPLESLTGGEMLSVPLNFDCGYTTEYSLTFTDIESFDIGTEIWLEDKLTGGDWISVNNQPEYHFSGSPDDAADRFILHFFGPTGTDELAKPTVDIYSSGQHAYVRNNTDESIREVRVYSLSGSLVRNLKTTDQKFMKIWVGDQMAYYVIRVITDQHVYTKKLFISK